MLIRVIKLFCLLILCFFPGFLSGQLDKVKLFLPKEVGFSYYDFLKFFPDGEHYVIASGSLAVINTETAEVVDETDLRFGARNLSVSSDGKLIMVSVNEEIYLYTFENQKLNLYKTITVRELISGLPNAEYYFNLPVSGCFFTKQQNVLFANIGSFVVQYDFNSNQIIKSHAYPLTDYRLHSVYYPKTDEVISVVMSGSSSKFCVSPVNNPEQISELPITGGIISKIKVRDSLLFCYATDKFFTYDLHNKKVVHEIRMPKYEYSFIDPKLMTDVNKRTSITKPDTINFGKDEYVFDMDYLRNSGEILVATGKGLKFIRTSDKKLTRKIDGVAMNVGINSNGSRLIVNSHTSYRAIRVYNGTDLNLIAEKPATGQCVYSAAVSPGNKFMYTNGSNGGHLWDLSNFSKIAYLRDISESDSSFIMNVQFLGDSQLMVNSGKNINHLNLSVYDIRKKKYIKTLRKDCYAIVSGFYNQSYYYADYKALHVFNINTGAEEVFEGSFMMAASPMYDVIKFTDNLIFIPDYSGFKVLNRKTRKVICEMKSSAMPSKVIFSADEKYLILPLQYEEEKNTGGVKVKIPVNGIARIELASGKIINKYCETFMPYSIGLDEQKGVLNAWYIKYDATSGNAIQNELLYSEFDLKTGDAIFSKSLGVPGTSVNYHFADTHQKYFVLADPLGNYFKIYGNRGEELMDLSSRKLSNVKCFFNHKNEQLIITGISSSLVTFVDLKNRKVIGQLANAGEDQFFLVTEDLKYMGSKSFVKSIRFKYNSEIFGFEQFDAYLNQPHTVLKAFACSDTALIRIYENAYLKRMKILGMTGKEQISFSSIPEVKILGMKPESGGKLTFSIRAVKGKSNLSTVRILNNGVVIDEILIPEEQNKLFECNRTYETTGGMNRFEFIAVGTDKMESARIGRYFNNASQGKPDLYLVVMASEKFKDNRFDLNYAVKDASDMASTISGSDAFKNVHIRKLYNTSFQKDSVKKLDTWLSKANLNDVVMFFFAGHGYLDSDFNYYFPTYYTNFDDPSDKAVPYAAFEKLFNSIKPTRKLMFIDACFSGEVDEDATEINEPKTGEKKDSTRSISIARGSISMSSAMEISKEIFSDLRKGTGATIISSAGGNQAALEGEKWDNGLFTHCVINGLSKKRADFNQDGKIMLSELQKFVSDEVYRLSEGTQLPTYRIENTILDYQLW